MQGTSSPSPILSLTVIDGRTLDDEGRLTEASAVLIAVRDPATNVTHPHVVSVPTMRMPQVLFDACVSEAVRVGDGPSGAETFYRAGATSSDHDNGHAATVYAAESLLARKLGLGAAIESGELRYRAAVRCVVRGVAAYDGDDGAAYEPVAMLNIVAVIDEGVEQLPMRTASYSVLAWTSVARFLDGVETRNPMRLSDAVDPIEMCVHGVCLDAARTSIDHLMRRVPIDDSPVQADARLLSLPQSLFAAEVARGG